VLEAVGDRATVIAGVGTNSTEHTVGLARTAEKAGAHGLLAVTPYYSKPPQAGVIAHFTAVADSCGLPLMLYDIPGRSGIPIELGTMVRLAEHHRIVAIKDAKGDIATTSWVTARTDLAIYSGDDKNTLPLLSVGAVGVVGVATHLFGGRVKGMIEAYERGEVREALATHHRLLPVFDGFFRTQGVILAKAALRMAGLPAGPVRLPLVNATVAQTLQLHADCLAAGFPAAQLADPAGRDATGPGEVVE
jgi:4-hydroxy-tetrahydrodipicolinate synthase